MQQLLHQCQRAVVQAQGAAGQPRIVLRLQAAWVQLERVLIQLRGGMGRGGGLRLGNAWHASYPSIASPGMLCSQDVEGMGMLQVASTLHQRAAPSCMVLLPSTLIPVLSPQLYTLTCSAASASPRASCTFPALTSAAVLPGSASQQYSA